MTDDIIPHTTLTTHQLSWQKELANAVREPAILAAHLKLNLASLPFTLPAQQGWSLRVPHPYLQRMNKGDPNDPLLRQVLPIANELEHTPGFSNDPLGENDTNPIPGLVHKYHGRALFIVSPACAIHCRYCFRRHFPYEDNKPSREQWLSALHYLTKDTSIKEVIYSGGDPLAANDKFLLWLTEQIAKIPHIQRLRIHTRLPLVIPARIDDSCLHWLTSTRLKVVMVWHINHPNEIDEQVMQATQRLKKKGIELLNQTVLLKQVNDCADTLIALSDKLLLAGILPYYLHRLDKVNGAAHFEVHDDVIQNIQQQLIEKLPGYLVPKFVYEQAGARSKLPITFARPLTQPLK